MIVLMYYSILGMLDLYLTNKFVGSTYIIQIVLFILYILATKKTLLMWLEQLRKSSSTIVLKDSVRNSRTCDLKLQNPINCLHFDFLSGKIIKESKEKHWSLEITLIYVTCECVAIKVSMKLWTSISICLVDN